MLKRGKKKSPANQLVINSKAHRSNRWESVVPHAAGIDSKCNGLHSLCQTI